MRNSIENGFNRVQKNFAREETSNDKMLARKPTMQFFELFNFMKVFS